MYNQSVFRQCDHERRPGSSYWVLAHEGVSKQSTANETESRVWKTQVVRIGSEEDQREGNYANELLLCIYTET